MRQTCVYREAEDLVKSIRQPGSGLLSDCIEIDVSPDGCRAVFAGTMVDELSGVPPTRVALTDLCTGDTRILTFGPNIDRLPKFSPDGRQVAFLSDRIKSGDFQLYLLDLDSGAARRAARHDGWVEYLQWSPDGKHILLVVADHGADTSGGQGAISSSSSSPSDFPFWMPNVEFGDENLRWRRLWIYNPESDQTRLVAGKNINVWEAAWCGNGAVAVVASGGPGEGEWYGATLQIVDVRSGERQEVYKSVHQLGWPAASRTGKYLAIVEALCSDRWFVAGDLRIVDRVSGQALQIDTQGVDVSYIEWRSEEIALLAGHRGFETVVGLVNVPSGKFIETWKSCELTAAGGFYAAVAGVGNSGDCVLSGRGFIRAPEIATIRNGEYQTIRSFDVGYGEAAKVVEAVDRVIWNAADGLEIQGWLILPKGKSPHPLVMQVHGGPVNHFRPMWLAPLHLMLLKRGYSIFLPNPRGSSGRGQGFVRRVYGDMGGADAEDLLTGLDTLVRRGIADPIRIGVTGASYGGFMTSWLITRDSRFAAAIPVSPHTNQVTEHLLGNLPHFMAMIMQDQWNSPGGAYFHRSPINFAHKVKTPTMNVAGALDRCTPPTEAAQFHSALRENGAISALVVYPLEGHGIRHFPASIDYTARAIDWFERYLGASASYGGG